MSQPKLPKSKIECPTCDKASGFSLGPGFSRRRFLQVAGTAIVPSDFAPTSFLGGTLRFPQGLMPKTAQHLDKMLFVRPGLAWAAVHQLGQSWAQIARNPGGATGAIAPHIGAVVSLEEQAARSSSDVLPGFIALNSAGIPTSGYFPATYAPFQVIPPATGLPTIRHPYDVTRFNSLCNFLHQLDANRTRGA